MCLVMLHIVVCSWLHIVWEYVHEASIEVRLAVCVVIILELFEGSLA